MEIESGQVLSHYHLIEKIGQGGMGVVWKARDSILGREVAIKVLPADSALDAQRRRMFLEEARLASSVSDAHIVQVFELGREGDLDFIVMEYVEGEPLSKSLTGRPLPSERVAALGEQVARALARAHRKQLLHRDIKPGNILVTHDGEVKLVDFGLAALFRPEQPAQAAEPLLSTQPLAESTSTWMELDGQKVFGTLPYMSPEQVRGEKLDQRSDIFSLGTVLYEMTTGRRPFRGESAAQVAAEIRSARSRPPRDVLPRVPVDLDRIVLKSLAGRPAERYQTMEDLAVDLRKLGRDLDSGSAPSYDSSGAMQQTGAKRRRLIWAIAGAAAVALVIVAAWLAQSLWQPVPDPHTILILPLEVRGQTDGAAYVGRAFAEAMAVNLAQAEGLKVLPVPDAKELEGIGTQDRLRAASSQRAGLMLAGSLTRNGANLQADVSLTDTSERRLIWGTRLQGEERDLAVLAGSAVEQIQSKLDVRPLKRYEYYTVPYGSEEFLRSAELAAARESAVGSSQYIETTRRLVEAFPQEVYARFLLTHALWFPSENKPEGSAEVESFEQSMRELNRLDPRNPWDDFFHANLLDLALQRDEALERFRRVLERSDLSARLRSWILALRGQALSGNGHLHAALQDYEEALALTPLNAPLLARAAEVHLQMGQLERGMDLSRKAYAVAPNEPDTIGYYGDAIWRTQSSAAALPYLEKDCRVKRAAPGGQDTCCATYGVGLAYEGKFTESIDMLRGCCTQMDDRCAPFAAVLQVAGRPREALAAAGKAATGEASQIGFYGLMLYHARAGNRAQAIGYLRRLLDRGYADIWVASDPWLESLHGDPEFESILAEMKQRMES